jgi:hypothetical protein
MKYTIDRYETEYKEEYDSIMSIKSAYDILRAVKSKLDD